MTSENDDSGERRLAWSLLGISVAVAAALVIAAVVWSWPLKVVAGGLQLLGIVLAMVGVGVIWRWLRRAAQVAAQVAVAKKHDIEGSLAIRRGERRGLTQSIGAGGIESAEAWGTPTVTGPHAVSDSERLAHLVERMDAAERDRALERAEWEDRLTRLGVDILANTREGWQLVLAGLVWSALGTIVGVAA